MIIESKFKDYYDGFLPHDQRDPKVVYKRVTRGIDLKKAPDCQNIRDMLRDTYGWEPTSHWVSILIIAGKLYPFGATEAIGYHGGSNEIEFDYENPYHKFQPEKGSIQALMSKKYPKKEASWGQSHQEAEELNRSISPVLVLTSNRIYLPRSRVIENALTADPVLKALRFPMNGHELIQNIMGFMASKPNPTVTTTDAIRAQAHGMDQTSFRRDKGGPTRKRKKTK